MDHEHEFLPCYLLTDGGWQREEGKEICVVCGTWRIIEEDT